MTDGAFCAAWDTVSRGYSYSEYEGVGIYTLPAFNALPGIRHGFSARMGGVSEGHLASLNLSFSRETENRENVMRNFSVFCRAAGVSEDSMVMDNFAHGAAVRRVDRDDAGRGYTREPLPSCDALMTDDPAVTLVTGHADCMAIYVVDPVRRAVALAHAGWRGALLRIGGGVLTAMRGAFGTAAADVYAGIGPAICVNCFEVDADIAEAFRAEFPDTPCIGMSGKTAGKRTVDLWMTAVRQLWDAGVPAARISLMNVCSYEEARLYSHRRDGGRTGGMAAFLGLT